MVRPYSLTIVPGFRPMIRPAMIAASNMPVPVNDSIGEGRTPRLPCVGAGTHRRHLVDHLVQLGHRIIPGEDRIDRGS